MDTHASFIYVRATLGLNLLQRKAQLRLMGTIFTILYFYQRSQVKIVLVSVGNTVSSHNGTSFHSEF